MIYPKTDFRKWAETYDLSLDPIVCPKCGLSQELKNPVAFEEWRGIESDIHSCGPKY